MILMKKSLFIITGTEMNEINIYDQNYDFVLKMSLDSKLTLNTILESNKINKQEVSNANIAINGKQTT